MEDHELFSHRKSYEKEALLEEKAPENPMELFALWYDEAEKTPSTGETNAMTLSTTDKDNSPLSRIVLLKKFSWEGFYFYTNYNSRKGKAIEHNSNVCLSFFWQTLERQVIICGNAQKTSVNNSDGYFKTRPKGSQLGALASNQSEVVPSREFLDNKLQLLEKQYESQNIERPKHWGGYIVKPLSIEFWQGRPNRIHDRLKYSLKENLEWKIERLSP